MSINWKFVGGFGLGFVAGGASVGVLSIIFGKKIIKAKANHEANRILSELDIGKKEKEEKKEVEEGCTGDLAKDSKGTDGDSSGVDGGKSKDSGSKGRPVWSYGSEGNSINIEKGGEYDNLLKKYGNYHGPVDPVVFEHPDDEDSTDNVEAEGAEYEEKVRNGELITDENRSYFEGEQLSKEMNSGKKPKLITSESYDNEYPHHDKIQLEYYTGEDGSDGCLVDIEADEEIFDEARVVGDCLDRYGFRTNDEEVIFVRNFSFGADYEISKVRGPWIRM